MFDPARLSQAWFACAAAIWLLLSPARLVAQSAQVIATEAQQRVLQDRAAGALAAEFARERRGDCADAGNTIEANNCLAREMAATDANYKSFVLAVGGLLRLVDAPNEAAAAADVGHRFDGAEAMWASYRKSSCDAVYQHYIDGTVRGVAYGNCMQTIARGHMHELAAIYSEMLGR